MARYELSLRDYYRIIRRHIVVVLAVAVGTGGLTFLSSQDQEIFTASATVRITRFGSLTGLLLEAFYWSPEDNISTQTRLITSQPVLQKIAERQGRLPLGLDQKTAVEDSAHVFASLAGRIGAQQVEASSLVEITAEAREAEEAVALANDAATAYVAYSKEEASRQNVETREYIKTRLDTVRVSLDEAQSNLRVARSQSLPSSAADLNSLLRLLERRQNLYDRGRSVEEQLNRLAGDAAVVGLEGTRLDQSSGVTYSESFAELMRLHADRRRLLQDYTPEAPPVQRLDIRIGHLRSEIQQSLIDDYAMLDEQLKAVEELLDSYPAEEIAVAEATRRIDLYGQLVSQLETSLQEAQIQEKDQVEEVRIVNFATSARSEGGTTQAPKTIVGFLLGLMLGFVLAFVLESMDTSIGTIEDVEEYLELPVLSVIPHLGVEKVAAALLKENPRLEDDPNLDMYARLITQYDPKSPAAEAYRTLRTNLQFATAAVTGEGEIKNTFVFSSASLQEGKSTTIVNLAITMAQAGSKVLLLGCNMRRPTIYKSFGIPREKGMVDILTGQMDWHDCVKTVTDMMVGPLSLSDVMAMPGLDNLHIITAGGIPPNPSELLNSPRFAELIAQTRLEFDYVIVDAPPILPVTDSAVVARQVDWSVLVYQVGKVPRNALRRARSHLQNVGSHVLGIAMNDVKAEIGGYSPYSQYMTKYYGEETKVKRSVFKRVLNWFRRETGRDKARPEDIKLPVADKDEGDKSWISVDYYENGGKRGKGDSDLSTLPYAHGTPQRVVEEPPDEVEKFPHDVEPSDAGFTDEEEKKEKEEKKGKEEEAGESERRRGLPIWLWIALAIILVLVVLTALGVFDRLIAGPGSEPVEAAVAGKVLEPSMEAAPTPAGTEGTYTGATSVWTVQVGSFRSEAEALGFRDRLHGILPDELEGSVWIEHVTSPQIGRWYRVYVGRYGTRAAVDDLAKRLLLSERIALALPILVPFPIP